MSFVLMPNFLVNLAFALATLGFLVRDILWLRLLTILGYSVFFMLHVSQADGPAWNFVIWYSTLMAINGGHAIWLLYERRLLRLTDEEARLKDLVFAPLDPIAVKRLMRAGDWLDLPAGEVLTRKGEPPPWLLLIAEGEVVVRDGETLIARLGRGQFVGEIAFLRETVATATTAVPTGGPVRCLAWEPDRLRRRIARRDALRVTLFAAIGSDLAAKIAENNVRVTAPEGATAVEVRGTT